MSALAMTFNPVFDDPSWKGVYEDVGNLWMLLYC